MMAMTDFDSFLASAKEVPCAEFYASPIAQENCIEPDWFDNLPEPECFTVLDGEQWFAKFDDRTYWTMVEQEDRYADLTTLARWVYDWLNEETNEHLR
jgi:hypothetical protein